MIPKDNLKQTLMEQRDAILQKQLGIERTILKSIEQKAKLPHVVVLTGLRRSGKSTLLRQLMKKYYSEVCLLEQPFIKDEDKTIEQILVEKTSEIGEKISIRRFARFELGEGIEKKKQSFAEEVEEQLG